MLTPEQRAQVVQAMARITSMRYDLGEIGKKLEEFADVEAIAEPCFHVDDAVQSISCARSNLDTANYVLDLFAGRTERRASKMAKLITINGESATRAGWARKLNVTRGAICFRQKKFGETAEEAVKHFYFKSLAHDEQSQVLASLKFYKDSYVKNAMQTISYAMPQLVGNVAGVGRMLGNAIADLEEVVRLTEKRIKELETNDKEGK